ncbi:hypothetical protein M8494_15220 [Serratia ureilytica]
MDGGKCPTTASRKSCRSVTYGIRTRHITEKINARNRLEFYSLYNVLRYFNRRTRQSNSTPLALLAVATSSLR